MPCLSETLGKPASWCKRPAPWSPNICRCTLASDPAPGRSLVVATTRYCVPAGSSPRSSSRQILLQCSHALPYTRSRPSSLSGMPPLSSLAQHSQAWRLISSERRFLQCIRPHSAQQLSKGIPALHQSILKEAVRLKVAGSTAAPTTCACSSSLWSIRAGMAKPCIEAKADKRMQTLHSALKKHCLVTAHAKQGVAC